MLPPVAFDAMPSLVTQPEAPLPRMTRSQTREQAILDAAVALVAELGYERVTMNDIAARARASKATMYRKWPTKADLINAALERHAVADEQRTWEDTGSLRGDLVAVVRGISRITAGNEGPSFLGMLEAVRADPKLRDLLRRQITRTAIKGDTALVARARDRGENVREDGTAWVYEIAIGAVIMQTLLRGERPDEAFEEELVDRVLMPLMLDHSQE